MKKIAVIQEFEEDRFDEIPKWDGESIDTWTDLAVLLTLDGKEPWQRWLPIQEIRRTEDGLSIYASTWIMEKKRLL